MIQILCNIPAKIRWPALAVLFCPALAVAYILDVWLVGTAAAFVAAVAKGLEHFPAPPDFGPVAWYWQHPFFTARAWLFDADKLSNPEVRTCWIFLNSVPELLMSPLHGVTEEMVLHYLSATKNELLDRQNPVQCKKIMDAYVHEIKVLDDSVDIVFKIPLGADKGGVGGGT